MGAEKARTKLQDAAQDFQENQWPVIKRKSMEAHAKYEPVVKEYLGLCWEALVNAATRVCDESSQPRAEAAKASDVPGTAAAEVPETEAAEVLETEAAETPEAKSAEVPEKAVEVPQVASSAEPPAHSTVGKSQSQAADAPRRNRVSAAFSSPEKEAPKSKQLDYLKPYGPGEFQRRKDVFSEGVTAAG